MSAATGAAADRGLADDVLSAAWTVLHRNTAEVINADRPWAYLMYSAQRQVTADAKAQQLLTSPSAVRGRARHLLPSRIRLVGAAPAELAVAFRHEPSGAGDGSVRPQVADYHTRPLLDPPVALRTTPRTEREPWYSAFIEILVDRGSDRAVTTAAVDRLADLFTTSASGMWECEARRDPVLAGLGLSADQAGALVALMAGSRRFRHNGKQDSLLVSIRSTHPQDHPVHPRPHSNAAWPDTCAALPVACNSATAAGQEPPSAGILSVPRAPAPAPRSARCARCDG